MNESRLKWKEEVEVEEEKNEPKPDYSDLENNRLIRIPDQINNKLEHVGK